MPVKVLSKPIDTLVCSGDIVSADRKMTVQEAVEKMREASCGSIIVLEDKKPIGIFTDRDYLNKLSTSKEPTSQLKLIDYMTPNPQTISKDRSIASMLTKMRLGNFRHMLVTNAQGELESIVSFKDVIDYLLDALVDAEEEQAVT